MESAEKNANPESKPGAGCKGRTQQLLKKTSPVVTNHLLQSSDHRQPQKRRCFAPGKNGTAGRPQAAGILLKNQKIFKTLSEMTGHKPEYFRYGHTTKKGVGILKKAETTPGE